MKILPDIAPSSLEKQLSSFWKLAANRTLLLKHEYDASKGSPVFTSRGKYTTRGWTEWTQGFQYGIPLLIFSATGDEEMLTLGREATRKEMAHHLTHFGVHDHGFNNLSTYGHLLRCANTGLFEAGTYEPEYYRLAIRVSGAVQARRWTDIPEGGFIHSFNGPHSLFIDTMRTCRILLAAHSLGHRMLVENDREVDLLERAVVHGMTTARFAVYYGEGRDSYDIRGRVAHESVFNPTDGAYRCPNSQQGFSGFTTWTRGLAWAMLGFTEFIEYLNQASHPSLDLQHARSVFLEAARATCDFYLAHTSLDGIPYWDTGAPGLHRLGDYASKPADPLNDTEPVDSSAAAIAAQGLIRLGRILTKEDPDRASAYSGAGLTVLRTLLADPYLSPETGHQGILLHSIYHRPNGWDHIPEGRMIPCGESSMWGDYHMTELCYLVQRMNQDGYYTFFEGMH